MQEFFENVFRYPRYLIALIFGVFWNFLEPLLPMLKRPTTAIALVGLLISVLVFLTFTLQAMLGLSGTSFNAISTEIY
jgi:membrane protein insertase Oxa1/YidC/SpoIIIJ